jgi:hypothetical protein
MDRGMLSFRKLHKEKKERLFPVAAWRTLPIISAAGAVIGLLFYAARGIADEKKDFALSALEFGGSVGKLLWVSIEQSRNAATLGGDKYQSLATSVQQKIEFGRASSSVVANTWNTISTFAAYAAVDAGCSFRTVSTRGGTDVRCQRELCDQAHAAG